MQLDNKCPYVTHCVFFCYYHYCCFPLTLHLKYLSSSKLDLYSLFSELLSIMPYWPVTDHTGWKQNNIFQLNRANQQEWLKSFAEFPRAKSGFVKNGTANFGQNFKIEIRGPPPEVVLNIVLVKRKLKRTFPSEFQPKFRESSAKWKAPYMYIVNNLQSAMWLHQRYMTLLIHKLECNVWQNAAVRV